MSYGNDGRIDIARPETRAVDRAQEVGGAKHVESAAGADVEHGVDLHLRGRVTARADGGSALGGIIKGKLVRQAVVVFVRSLDAVEQGTFGRVVTVEGVAHTVDRLKDFDRAEEHAIATGRGAAKLRRVVRDRGLTSARHDHAPLEVEVVIDRLAHVQRDVGRGALCAGRGEHQQQCAHHRGGAA